MDIQKLNQNLNKLNKFLFIILGIAVAIWIGVEVFIGSKVEYAKEQMKENLCEAYSSSAKKSLIRLGMLYMSFKNISFLFILPLF